jgi:hypothetical protein
VNGCWTRAGAGPATQQGVRFNTTSIASLYAFRGLDEWEPRCCHPISERPQKAAPIKAMMVQISNCKGGEVMSR